MISARRAFLLLYTASGAAALVYEVTWTRLLTLQLGHTVAAASTVLAAFMGGLAGGAWIAGRLVGRTTALGDGPRTAALLRIYAALELTIAGAALALPFALQAAMPALAWAYADGEAPTRLAIVRVVISLAMVGIPAAAMGATFPVAVAWYMGTGAGYPGTGARRPKGESEQPTGLDRSGSRPRSTDSRPRSTDSRPRSTGSRPHSSDAGVLYAMNTAGAALGALAAGFWLIPVLGLRGTTAVGVALNVIAAAGALWIAAKATDNVELDPQGRRTQRPAGSTTHAATPALASAAAALSGFTALVYEVAWTRLIALVVGPTTYAFATMAAAFITGLAIGSAAGARLARRTPRPAMWLGAMLIVGGVAASAASWYTATEMPLAVARQVAAPDVDFTAVVLTEAFQIAVLLLPVTLALGASFPLALAAAGAGPGTAPRDAARVYAANTLGAIAGALVAGFVLIPLLGLRDTIRAAAFLAGLSGAAVCFAADAHARLKLSRSGESRPERSRVRAFLPAAAGAAAVAIILLMPPWDRTLLASGAYKYAPYLGSTDLDAVLRAGTLEYYKEGAAGTVSVRDLTGTRSLAIDGKVDASNGGDMLTQRLLGLLPVLVHGNAQDVCVIGLGSGVTLGSALAAGTVRRADVVEISPEVVEASRLFDAESGRVLSQPGVRLVVGDGRSHLLLTPRQYDVIVSEPSNPWMAGVAALFTREFFEAARARLKPDGLLCQWAHTYDISDADLRSIVRTFASVFPQSTLWLVGGGDLLLIGAKDGAIAPRLAAVEPGCRKPAVAAALPALGLTERSAPFALLSMFAAGPDEIERYGGSAAIQTDDRLTLEYSAPRAIYGRTKDDNAATIRMLDPARPDAVRSAIEGADDEAWVARGTLDLKAQAFASAYDAFKRAATLNSRNVTALAGLSDAAGGTKQLLAERDWLQDIARRQPDNAAVRIELSRVLAVTGDLQAAVEPAADALRLSPNDPRAAEQLASVLADAGNGERLGPLAQAMIERFPDRPDARYYQATALYLRGQTQDAISAARQVVDSRPDHARAQGLIAAGCATLGRRDCAKAAFDAAIRANPRDPASYVSAGVFSLESADPAAALSYFSSALAIDPTLTPARNGLAQARAQLAGSR